MHVSVNHIHADNVFEIWPQGKYMLLQFCTLSYHTVVLFRVYYNTWQQLRAGQRAYNKYACANAVNFPGCSYCA